MGNFAEDPNLVRLIIEFDFLLTDYAVLPGDCLWGVYGLKHTHRVPGKP
jgi:hypothetical protein